ncbi:MAG: hypothetical protein AAB926_01970, partial [Patescibacteria group bacterium]
MGKVFPQLSVKKPIRLFWIIFLAVISGFFVVPSSAEAELTLPSTTPCNFQQEHFEIYGVNQHLAGASSVRENGTIAFSYG